MRMAPSLSSSSSLRRRREGSRCEQGVALIVLLLLSWFRSAACWNFEAKVNTNEVDLRVTAMVGRNATLACPTKNRDTHRVAWIKHETRTILSLHGELVTQSSRYGIEKKEMGSYDLFISNIQESDAGTYICQVNSNPMENLVILLFVAKSPNIKVPPRGFSDKVEASVGETTRLECRAEGIPRPNITWKKIGDPTWNASQGPSRHHSSWLELTVSSLRDAGQYMCIANNGYPPSVGHTFQLNVRYKPILRASVQKKRGFPQVVCQAEGYPELNRFGIRRKEGRKHHSWREVDRVTTVRKGTRVTMTAAVDPILALNIFECFAENALGEERLKLKYKGPAEAPASFDEFYRSTSENWKTTETEEQESVKYEFRSTTTAADGEREEEEETTKLEHSGEEGGNRKRRRKKNFKGDDEDEASASDTGNSTPCSCLVFWTTAVASVAKILGR